MSAALESPDCALCGSNGRSIVHPNAHDLLQGIPGEFAVVRCLNCSLVYLCPRPTPEHLRDYYPAHYDPFTTSKDPPLASSEAYKLALGVSLALYRKWFGNEAMTLPPFGQRRLLDVGCGGGEYLQDMQGLGWDVYGVDLSEIAVQHARNRIGRSRVCIGALDTLDRSLKEFDLITMNHSLEHVPDPQATVKEAARRLAVNGKLKIVVPDVSGFEAKTFGRYWIGLDVPRHLSDFSERTLCNFLQRERFFIESCRPQFCPQSIFYSFELAVSAGLSTRWQKIARRLHKAVLLVALLSYSIGNRGFIEVVARRIT